MIRALVVLAAVLVNAAFVNGSLFASSDRDVADTHETGWWDPWYDDDDES